MGTLLLPNFKLNQGPRHSQLMGQVVGFEQRINAEPLTLADRLWVKTHLKPEKKNSGSHPRRGLSPCLT
jgi:hypothetical protein